MSLTGGAAFWYPPSLKALAEEKGYDHNTARWSFEEPGFQYAAACAIAGIAKSL